MRLAACSVFVVLGAIVTARAQTAAPASVDACSLLTKEDATAALGEAVTGPKATKSPNGPSACEFTGSGLHTINLIVRTLTAAEASVYKGLCAKKTHDGLTGLGETSCWYNEKHEELQVMKGLTMFSIEMRRSGDPTEAIKAVAQKVYARVK
ncbi:MAG TPA: hypothetical protein VJN96_19310 [Vicinamibacterales bacterium]|nr:hypothetical protein [Vicinamibacterales bacterium]